MNESYAMPTLPEGAREGILRGMHRVREARKAHSAPPGYTRNERVRLLGAGTILQEVLAAADLLEEDWGVGADVFSVTSFTELRREGMEASRARRIGQPAAGRPPVSWVEAQLPNNGAPVIAASDYVSAVPDVIRPWVRDTYVALGTDGFGRSDTRAALRRFFEVDRRSIALAALSALGDPRAAEARRRYGIDPAAAPPWTR
jgi:pyruvate dehydrogenase E1 component